MASNAIKYLSNVGKSVVYSTVDQFKEMNPAIMSFKETNSDTLKATYDAIRHIKTTVKKTTDNVLDSDYGKLAIKAKKNLFEDIKTGQFYNRERIEKANEEAAEKFMGMDDFDMDFGSGNSDVDFGFDDDDSISSNDMMDLVGEKSSTAISTAVARSSEYIVTANAEMNKVMYEQNNAIFSGIHSNMSTINDNIGQLIKFANGPFQTHIENSTKFFETTTKLDEERNSMLKEMLELQKNYYKSTKIDYDNSLKRTSIDDILDSEGMIDLSALVDLVKKNVAKSTDSNGLDMVKFMMESGVMETMISSPMKFVTDTIAKTIIPNALEKSIRSFNSSLSGLFASGIAKINSEDGGNPIIDFLKTALHIDTSVKTKIDTGKYNKGPTPFDGITKKAITEVIPTYLSQIVSALTGNEQTRYNYDTGKFVKVSKIQDVIKNIERSASDRAAMDIQSYFYDYKRQIDFGAGEEAKRMQEQFDQDLKAILDYSYKNGMLFNSKDKRRTASSYGLKNGKASDVNLEIIRSFFDKLPDEVKLQYATEIYRAKDNQNREMEQLENSGSSLVAALFNESIETIKKQDTKAAAAAAPVERKNAVLEVLNDIYDEVRLIRENFGIRGSRKNKRKVKTGRKPTISENNSGSSNSNSSFFSFSNDTAESYSDLTAENAYDKISGNLDRYEDSLSIDKSESKTLFDKIMETESISKKSKILYQELDEIIKKPTDLLAGIIQKANKSMYNMIFGTNESRDKKDRLFEEKGIAGAILDGLQNQFDKFSTWFESSVIVPISKMLNKDLFKKKYEEVVEMLGYDPKTLVKNTREKLFGKKDENGNVVEEGAVKRFGGVFKSVGSSYKETMSGILDKAEITKKLNEQGENKKNINTAAADLLRSINKSKPKTGSDDGAAKIENAAAGIKRVAKTGVVAVSEGEMIIPSSLNPYDIEKNTKKENIAKEKFKKNFGYDNFIPGYAKGGEVSLEDYITKAIESGDESKIKSIKSNLEKLIKKNPDKFDKIKKAVEGSAEKTTKDLGKSDYVEGRDKSILGKSIQELIDGVKTVKDYVKGLAPDKDKEEKEKESMMGSAIDELKKYIPEVGAGAVIGGGVSLITGMIGGPLLGAAVGSAISLVKHSDKIQKMLFGDDVVDEKGNKTGEKSGGLLSKELSTKLNKYAPAVGKGAIAGAITSILPFVPGGPVAGIIVGSALGFASQNEEIKNKIFGEDTKLGKITNTLKKALPKMGAGSLVGLIAGPFGVTTNLILGSAVGFATSTDKFKNLMFGYTDEDGTEHDGILKIAMDNVVNPLKEFAIETKDSFKEWTGKYILQPLKDASDPLKTEFKLMVQGIADHFKGTLDKYFKDRLGAPFDKWMKDNVFKPLTGFIKKFIGGALSPIKAIVSAPFKAIGAIGDHFRTKQIQNGDAQYMNAAQRLEYRKAKGRGITGKRWNGQTSGRFTKYDESIVNLSDDP